MDGGENIIHEYDTEINHVDCRTMEENLIIHELMMGLWKQRLFLEFFLLIKVYLFDNLAKSQRPK